MNLIEELRSEARELSAAMENQGRIEKSAADRTQLIGTVSNVLRDDLGELNQKIYDLHSEPEARNMKKIICVKHLKFFKQRLTTLMKYQHISISQLI
jgi:hypothetical protein